MKVYSAGITPPSVYTKSFEELNKDFKDYMDALKQFAINLGSAAVVCNSQESK